MKNKMIKLNMLTAIFSFFAASSVMASVNDDMLSIDIDNQISKAYDYSVDIGSSDTTLESYSAPLHGTVNNNEIQVVLKSNDDNFNFIITTLTVRDKKTHKIAWQGKITLDKKYGLLRLNNAVNNQPILMHPHTTSGANAEFSLGIWGALPDKA